MRSLKALALTAAVLLPPLAPGQSPQAPQSPAQQVDWRFADPGAQLIGGIDVHSLLNSPLVKAALEQAAAKMGPSALVMQMTLGTVSGVSQVYFSITARKEDGEGLMMIKGTLDDAAVRAFLQGAASGAGATPSSEPKPAQPKMDMARVDATTILMGSPSQLSAALRRIQRPASAVPNPLVARAKTLAAGNDFWIGGTLPDIPAIALIAGGIKGLALGISAQKDLRFKISLDMATAELAQQMAAQAQKSAGEALHTQAGLDTKVEAKVVGTTLNITSSMDGDQILKVLAEKLQDGVPPGALLGVGPTKATPATTASQPAPAPVPQGPRTVKILGLDDGPREVPFPGGQH
ncbi:MAG TPA: hypothetical protein VN841_07250 [Bryobacteraceae bacterium]|nr:hypothetical protein [Bryobacteraceae bacterium]